MYILRTSAPCEEGIVEREFEDFDTAKSVMEREIKRESADCDGTASVDIGNDDAYIGDGSYVKTWAIYKEPMSVIENALANLKKAKMGLLEYSFTLENTSVCSDYIESAEQAIKSLAVSAKNN